MPRPRAPLAALRAAEGTDAARAELEAAIDRYPTRAAAANALGIAPQILRRLALSVGIDLPRLRAGRPRRGG